MSELTDEESLESLTKIVKEYNDHQTEMIDNLRERIERLEDLNEWHRQASTILSLFLKDYKLPDPTTEKETEIVELVNKFLERSKELLGD